MRSALAVLVLLSHASIANAGIIQLGEQDFADGDRLSFNAFRVASLGEDAPFDAFRGSDPGGTSFSAEFTFQFDADDVFSADLTLGIFDHDSAASGSQIAAFTLDGFDLTDLLDLQFESRGGSQTEFNVYSIQIPFELFPALQDGMATFLLTLQPPGLGSNGLVEFPGNGAGLDFATLRVNVSEPTALALLALGSLAIAARRRLRSARGNRTLPS